MRYGLSPIFAVFGLCFACGQTYRLPPLELQTEPPAKSSGNSTSQVLPEETEPGVPGLYAAYLQGQKITVEKDGSQRACFTNLGSPCTGVVKTPEGATRALASTDTCSLTNPSGVIHVVVRDASKALLFEIALPLPDLGSLDTLPSEIGSGANRAILNGVCLLGEG